MSDEQQSNENKENAGDGDFAPGASAETSTEESGLVNEVLNFATGKVNRADQASARKQVAQFRKRHPRASQDELAQMLIKEKCIKTGSVGAATSGASIIPGLGTLTSMTVGVAADITLTYALQAELVLEIAEVYGYEMSDAERRNAILLVTGISAGANRALARAGTEVAEQVGTRIASKSLVKAIPVFGVAASTATNAVATYAVGKRAQAYFREGPEAVASWSDSLRALSGVDERKVGGWLKRASQSSGRGFLRGVRQLAGGAATAGATANEQLGRIGAATREYVRSKRAGDAPQLTDESGIVADGAARAREGEAKKAEADASTPESEGQPNNFARRLGRRVRRVLPFGRRNARQDEVDSDWNLY